MMLSMLSLLVKEYNDIQYHNDVKGYNFMCSIIVKEYYMKYNIIEKGYNIKYNIIEKVYNIKYNIIV